jgi:hypothetical protein
MLKKLHDMKVDNLYTTKHHCDDKMEDKVGSACGMQAIGEVRGAYRNVSGGWNRSDCVEVKMDIEGISWQIAYCLAEGMEQWRTVIGCAVNKRH